MTDDDPEKKVRKRKALIIAVSDYDPPSELNPLPFCRNDGEAVYEALKSKYDIPEKWKLVGKVEGGKMKEAIFEFFRKNDEPDDTLLFYFSGHGIPDSYGDHFLGSSNINEQLPDENGYNFLHLQENIKKTRARNVIAILDCCFSGAAEIGKGGIEEAVKARGSMEKIFEEGNGKCILASSLDGQSSYNMEGYDFSKFTYFLIQGLKGGEGDSVNDKGIVTPITLSNYVYNNIPLSNQQKPITRIAMSGDVAIIEIPSLARKKSDEKDSMLQLLRQGRVMEFNSEIGKYKADPSLMTKELSQGIGTRQKSYRLELEGANLSNLQLRNLDFQGVNISRALLTGSDLSGTNFDGANLTATIAKNMVCRGAKLHNAILEGTIMTSAILERTDFDHANMYKADLSYATMTSTILRNVNLSNSKLAYADLSDADLLHANLTEADLNNATLKSVNLSFAILYKTSLVNADFSRANLSYVNAMYANLTNANFSYANLANAKLSYSKFSGSDQVDEGASSWPVILANANLSGIEMSSVDLSGADLSGAVVLNCNEYGGMKCKDALFEHAIIDRPELVEYLRANGAICVPDAVRTESGLRNSLKNRGYDEERIDQFVRQSEFRPKSPIMKR